MAPPSDFTPPGGSGSSEPPPGGPPPYGTPPYVTPPSPYDPNQQPPYQPPPDPYGQPGYQPPYPQQPYPQQAYPQQPGPYQPPGYPGAEPPPFQQPGYQQPYYQGGYTARLPRHPSASTALTLGIVALVGGFFCALPILAAPFAWYTGGQALKEIDAQPGRWDGRDQAKAGQVLGIIGTALLALIVVGTIFLVALVAAAGSS